MGLIIKITDTDESANDIEYRQLGRGSDSWKGKTVHGESYYADCELLFELAHLFIRERQVDSEADI